MLRSPLPRFSAAAAATLRQSLAAKQASLVSTAEDGGFLLPAPPPGPTSAKGAKLRYGRGPLADAAREAAKRQEIAERIAERKVQNAVGTSLIGLYPVYDHRRQVAGDFTGTRVLQPAALRHALGESHLAAARVAADGKSLAASSPDDDAEFEEIEED
mmetsp:Transcript_16631/g.25199  ORF Transcript_16631/g.25199 Transcript_16631/m.25199 type:complete len:158 (-) Transcript_16631:85-558(-)